MMPNSMKLDLPLDQVPTTYSTAGATIPVAPSNPEALTSA